MKKALIFSLSILLTGCQMDYDEGFQKGQKAGFQQGVEAVQQQQKTVLQNTIELNEKSQNLIYESQKKLEELNQKLEETNLIESLWKSVAYPDLVLTRGLIVNVPIFSVWALPFAAWVLTLAAFWVWVARKMLKRTKPTDDDLRIIEEAKQAQSTINELEHIQGQHQVELAELQQTKAYTQQQTEEARRELSRINKVIEKNRVELNNLKIQKQNLKNELDDLSV